MSFIEGLPFQDKRMHLIIYEKLQSILLTPNRDVIYWRVALPK
jgi:hypothetical protein